MRWRRKNKTSALAITMPNPRLSTDNLCHALVPARCRRKGASTAIVPAIESPTAHQIKRLSFTVEDCFENSARNRSQIIG
jgi:hypothetical protein